MGFDKGAKTVVMGILHLCATPPGKILMGYDLPTKASPEVPVASSRIQGRGTTENEKSSTAAAHLPYSLFNSTAGLVFAAFRSCHRTEAKEIMKVIRTAPAKIHQ